jgi:hypothetical protein
VLDVDHDPHSKAALQAYAIACAQSHPQLSEDLIARHGGAQPHSAVGFDEWWDNEAKTVAPDTFKNWEASCRVTWSAALSHAQPAQDVNAELVEALQDLADAGGEAWGEERPCVRIARTALSLAKAAQQKGQL